MQWLVFAILCFAIFAIFHVLYDLWKWNNRK